MVPLIVLIVVLVAGGGIAFLLKARRSAAAASDAAGTGPNELLQSPAPTFPSSPGSSRTLDAAPADAEPASSAAEAVDDEDDDEDDDEVVVARFKAPGERSVGASEATRAQ